MKRLHIHIGVDNLDESIRFYSTLFGAAPIKTKSDYAKWLLDDPRVNFAISTRARTKGIDHLGIQVDDEAELAEVRDTPQGRRHGGGRRRRNGLLLRPIGEVVDTRPIRHRMGSLPDDGRCAALLRRNSILLKGLLHAGNHGEA